jgi:hypothetical protein
VIDTSNDTSVYLAVLEGTEKTSCIHYRTASISELCHAGGSLATLTPDELWAKYFRPPLEEKGLLSVADLETKHFPSTETLDTFFIANKHPIDLSSDAFHLVDTDSFDSKQKACSSLPNCSGWWRFSRIGYNKDSTEAIVHTDYEHPKYGLMGMGFFHLLTRTNRTWTIQAHDMTWIS